MNSMPLPDCLQVLHQARKDDVVITAMGVAREWANLSSHPLDWIYVPSSMGQASALGLGLAIAQPSRRVIVCNGDGSMLMNLGSLVTITAQSPKNLVLLVFVNGIYEVTGGQTTPGAAEFRKNRKDVDFSAMARACGFTSVYEFHDLAKWRSDVKTVIDATGPTFVTLWVAPLPDAGAPSSPGPGRQRVKELARQLARHTKQ